MLARLSLKAKLILSVAGSCLLIVLISLMAWQSLERVDQSLVDVTDRSVPKLAQLSEMRYYGSEVTRLFLRVSTQGLSEAEVTRLKGKLEEHVDLYEAAESKYLALPFEQGEEALYKSQNDRWKEALVLIREGVSLIGQTEEAAVERLYVLNSSAVAKAKVAHNVAFQSLHDFQTEVSRSLRDSAKQQSERSLILVLSCCLTGVLLNIIGGLLFARRLSRSLETIAQHLDGEATDVARAAEGIAKTSEDLSHGASAQAASLEETASSMNEISAMAASNTNLAQLSKEAVLESRKAAVEGTKAMTRILESIHEIDRSNNGIMQEVNRSNERMGEIVRIIESIQEKTKVINDIVFQTKLLSFNASVEAARAGNSGKGFAVVAEEVGKLAVMSGGAAREIEELLMRSVEQVRSTVAETGGSINRIISLGSEKIRDGVSVAARGSEVLQEIVANITMVEGHVQGIADAVQQQATGISEVNTAVTELDAVTQSNALASSTSAAASEELESRAARVHGLVSQLKALVAGESEGEGGHFVIEPTLEPSGETKPVASRSPRKAA